MLKVFWTLCLVSGISFQAFATHEFPLVPDPSKTPGDLCTSSDPDFTGYRYGQKIPVCRRSVSFALKTQIYEAYRIPESCRRNYTIDHFIPLSIGGNNRVENLWPEHVNLKKSRINFETELHLEVGQGQLTQDAAVDLVYRTKLHPQLNPKEAVEHCN